MTAARSEARRLSLLALLDGAGSGAYLAAVSVLLLRTSSLSLAGLALAAGALSRFLAVGWMAALSRRSRSAISVRRAYLAATVLMVAGAAGALLSAERGLILLLLLFSLASGAGNSLTSTLAATARRGQMFSFYPLLMAGGAAGSVFASLLLSSDVPLLPLLLLVCLQLVEPYLVGPLLGGVSAPNSALRLGADMASSAAVAAMAYGPLASYALLVASSVGEQWVGPAMVTYAVGAVVSSKLDRALSVRFGRYAADDMRLTLLLFAAALGTWALSIWVPGILAGRLLAGCLMFLGQGRLLRAAYGEEGSQTRVSAVSAGLGVGGGVGAVLTTSLVGLTGSPTFLPLLALPLLAVAFFPRPSRSASTS